MQTHDIHVHGLIQALKARFSPKDASLVIRALRQDPLIWQSLEQPEFQKIAIDQSGAQVRCWSPGWLALLALGETRPVEKFIAEPLMPIGQVWQEKVLQAFQSVQRTGKPPASLREAGLLALALRERRRLTGTWMGLMQELMPKSYRPEDAFHIWRTPLACLVGLVPDAVDLLRSLLPKNNEQATCDWIVRMQLSQPADPEVHAVVFEAVLQGAPVAVQLSVLRSLSLQGAERLAGDVAEALMAGHPAFAGIRSQSGPVEADLAALSQRALVLQEMGSFYQLAGDRAQALSLFTATESTLEQWLAGLYLQRMNLQSRRRADETIPLMKGDQIAQVASSAGWLKNALGAVLVSHPLADAVMEQVPGDQASPFLQLKRAHLMFEQEPALAWDLAKQGAAGLVEDIRHRGTPFTGDFVYAWRPQDALQILLELDLPDEALGLALVMLEVRPADVDLLYLTARIYERLGNLNQAARYACSCGALDPENPAWRRLLANLYGEVDQWEAAYAEWQAVLTLSKPPAMQDRLSCAQVALRAGHPDDAMQMAEALLAEDANNGAACGLMGQALIKLGDAAQAVNYLVRATLLAPEMITPWLALAEAQRALGEPQRALDTLRSAVEAAPEAHESHLALGESCISAGLLSEALPHLKKAFLLAPESAHTGLLYAKTLRMLGHSPEARGVLERIRSAWTTQPVLAYEYAQVLLDMGEAENALPILEMALHSGLPVLDGYLLYAKILLGEYRTGTVAWEPDELRGRMAQAGQALNRILEVDPSNLEARFLMGDIARERGDLEEALDVYRSLSELPASDTPELRWRIQWGLGRTAMELGELETALAAIKEACQVKPDSIPLHRTLAEAALRAQLPVEALDAAETVLHLAPDDVDNLAWFAGFTAGMGEISRAINALNSAVQIDPERADLLVEMAHWQIASGAPDAARACLEAAISVESAGSRELRRAGQVYLRLEDPRSAITCFEKALGKETNPPADLLFETARLYERMGNMEAALELTQRSIEARPDCLPVYLLQSDLLARLDRPQAALALLERALRMALDRQASPAGQEQMDENRLVLGAIYDRFTRLMLAEENLPAALTYAEKALEQDPHDAGLCYRAANLALALLQTETAARIITSACPEEDRLIEACSEQGEDGIQLACLKIEMRLAAEDAPVEATLDDRLANWIEDGLAKTPGNPRLLTAKARWMARQGDISEAQAQFAIALKSLLQADERMPRPLWVAEAALDVQRWKEALACFEQYAHTHPEEPAANLGLARALVLCAERERLCEAVGCRTNAPGSEAVDEAHYQRFEEAIQATGRLVTSSEIGRWQARGQVVFAPSAQATRTLAALPPTAEETAALAAALRLINNRTAAIQVTRRHAQDPRVWLQLALCYLGDPAPEGLAAAVRAVESHPNWPLSLVTLALLQRQSGDVLGALGNYEKALAQWENEPVWHEAAAELALEAGIAQQGIEHLKRALALDPGNAGYCFKLGQAYLEMNSSNEAIEALEKATVQDSQQALFWNALARAYHQAGRAQQALEAAKQAGALDPASAESLLIAGETALSLDRKDLALSFAQDAVRREPENASAVLFLSTVLVLLDNLQEGLGVLEQAALPVRQSFPVAFWRGKLIYRLHGAKAALDVLVRLSKEYPEEPALMSFLARIEAENGETKSAEHYAFKALRLEPNQPDLTLMLGRMQRKSGQLDQAVHLLSEAIRMSPENLEAYLELASVYQERREYDQAVEIYKQAIQVAPTDYEAYYQCGLIMRDSKDYAGAETMLRKAADLAPDNLSIRRQLVGVIALNLVHSKQEVVL